METIKVTGSFIKKWFFSGNVMCKKTINTTGFKRKVTEFVLKLLLSESTLPKAMGKQQ